MSIKDFNKYVRSISSQYLEMKAILTEFEKKKKDEYLGEDAINNIKTLISPLKANYDRVMYETFLLNTPNKDKKKTNYYKNNLDILDYCKKNNADGDYVLDENKYIIKELKEYLKTL